MASQLYRSPLTLYLEEELVSQNLGVATCAHEIQDWTVGHACLGKAVYPLLGTATAEDRLQQGYQLVSMFDSKLVGLKFPSFNEILSTYCLAELWPELVVDDAHVDIAVLGGEGLIGYDVRSGSSQLFGWCARCEIFGYTRGLNKDT